MTIDLANALCSYFEVLYNLNKSIITLCGVDVIDNFGQYEKFVDNVVFSIPRLVPYRKDGQQYKIDKNDGLMEYEQDLPFLVDGYSDLLLSNHAFLEKVKVIRTKLEHKMHVASITSSGSGNYVLLDVVYKVEDQEYTLYAGEMIQFAKQMNELFAKIQDEVVHFVFEKGKSGSIFYRRLTKYSFLNFNKIYESDVLRLVGKSLLPF